MKIMTNFFKIDFSFNFKNFGLYEYNFLLGYNSLFILTFKVK